MRPWPELVRTLTTADPVEAWRSIFGAAWDTCAAPLDGKSAAPEVLRRDREVGALDLFLATAGWDLWLAYEASVERTSAALKQWWSRAPCGRAVLILDALSLREAPWILAGARERGYTVEARVTGSEIPGDTTPFAQALGLAQRSSIANDGAGDRHEMRGARTETTGMAWAGCLSLIGSEPDWLLWHEWPDKLIHEHSDPGPGIKAIATDAATLLRSEDFWSLVERLTIGRRLVITSDHGYAAVGLFEDTTKDQERYLADTFKGSRCVAARGGAPGPFTPPLDLLLSSEHGEYRIALGRRKWKVRGGHPTLGHGGLTVLEVASPFIELSR